MKKIVALLICALSACTVKKENPVDTLAASSSTVSTTATDSVPQIGIVAAPASPVNPTDTTKPVASNASPTNAWTVTERGIGPLRAGMTVAEANKALGGGFSAPNSEGSCTYARLTKAPAGVAVMMENNKVARVEVRSGTTATAQGARIGDSEARINSIYGGRVTTTPHKYITGGHYLTITPVDGSQNRIVFETDGKAVTEYRAGALPAVAYVERCG
ncbi:MAG TPA: hypothetical protein VJ852_12445 [Gemmatimonadaceae bacterium]|nr:hypothetical protein [Gemmatimonadaceae bacterium]